MVGIQRHNRFTSCGLFPDGLLRLRQARLGQNPWCLKLLPVACWYEEDVSRGRTGGLQDPSGTSNMQDVRPSNNSQRMLMNVVGFRTAEFVAGICSPSDPGWVNCLHLVDER